MSAPSAHRSFDLTFSLKDVPPMITSRTPLGFRQSRVSQPPFFAFFFLPLIIEHVQPLTALCFVCQSSRNSCVRCRNAEAVVICFSCSRFYGVGGGKFCMCCFQACHPFYRVKHKWARLENMDQQAYRSSIERNIADIRGLLHVASNWGYELRTQDSDTKVGCFSAYVYASLFVTAAACRTYLSGEPW